MFFFNITCTGDELKKKKMFTQQNEQSELKIGYMAGNRSRLIFKILNGRQFYILSKFHKIERFQLI